MILQLFLVNQIIDTASPLSLPLKRAVRDLHHKLIASISILKRIQFYFKMLPNGSGNLGADLAKLSGTKSAPWSLRCGGRESKAGKLWEVGPVGLGKDEVNISELCMEKSNGSFHTVKHGRWIRNVWNIWCDSGWWSYCCAPNQIGWCVTNVDSSEGEHPVLDAILCLWIEVGCNMNVVWWSDMHKIQAMYFWNCRFLPFNNLCNAATGHCCRCLRIIAIVDNLVDCVGAGFKNALYSTRFSGKLSNLTWLTDHSADHSAVLKPPPSSARFYKWFARIPSSFPANADLTKNLVLRVLMIEHNSMWFNKLIQIAQPEIRFSCRSILELMLPLVYDLWKDTRVHRYHGLKNISPLETTPAYHCIPFFVQIAQTQALTTHCRQADWCLVRQRAGYREPTTALFPAKDPGWRFDHCSYKRFSLLLSRLSTYLRGKRRTWLTWLISSFWHTRKVD